ncbi:lytic transglycosylase domain-containing protein [Acetobacter senegalensis]|uniref:lytic transglycosylase domain-containing protein n=1 Tax=Acetobacter senegalensis TaxID=446692 RepID=UPI001EDC21F0|nr:lytic transglycosylase domain-containing protein [Acetobacter senegalensis]MCG4257423.1 transglycosylase SLT domain-containing protein [Acetobacter senegalensis]MCG4267375.1 transglycosylase SLT domain-containing protein [Acetobacter senegalensis]
MRAIGQISHNIAARAFMAGAALLASATVVATRAHAKPPEPGPDTHSEELAMVLPRQAFPEGDDIPLPKPLSPEVDTQIRAIFRLQRQGAFAEAITSTTRLTDSTLLGDIEADRYLNPAYHPGATELRGWLKKYTSYADAAAIWARLAALPQRGGALPPAPAGEHLTPEHATIPADPLTRDYTRNPLLDRTLRERTGWGLKGVHSALKLITATPGMTPAYAAQLQAETAQAMLDAGETDFALDIARTAVESAKGNNALAGFVAGLALWQQEQYAQAAPFFERASHARNATPEMRAACAFWAARAHEKLGSDRARHLWLQHAEAFPNSFYGLLAAHILHPAAGNHSRDHTHKINFAPLEEASRPSAPVLTEIDIEAVGSTEIGRRVFALLQVGEQERAENTIRRAWPDLRDVTLARSFQLVAESAGLHDLATEMSDALAAHEAHGKEHDDLPLPLLKPRHGFTMDPALVYALTRLESNFDPQAVSGAGAHGLMQIRPLTADFVTSGSSTTISRRFENAATALHDPSLNLEIGQRYVQYLADLTQHNTHLSVRGGDMIRLLASYNAGPSALARWEKAAAASDDPLLFMELIPNTETRDYVHRALSYLWIYASKLKLPTPSLTALTLNKWPDFADEQALAQTLNLRVLH